MICHKLFHWHRAGNLFDGKHLKQKDVRLSKYKLTVTDLTELWCFSDFFISYCNLLRSQSPHFTTVLLRCPTFLTNYCYGGLKRWRLRSVSGQMADFMLHHNLWHCHSKMAAVSFRDGHKNSDNLSKFKLTVTVWQNSDVLIKFFIYILLYNLYISQFLHFITILLVF